MPKTTTFEQAHKTLKSYNLDTNLESLVGSHTTHVASNGMFNLQVTDYSDMYGKLCVSVYGNNGLGLQCQLEILV